MIKQNDRREMLEDLKQGEVIRYKPDENSEEAYFIVAESKWGHIYGQTLIPIGVNSISIEELVEKEFSLANFSQ